MREGSAIAQRVWCRSAPSQDDLKRLLLEARDRKLSARAMGLLSRLAQLPPALRLAHNLRVYLGEAVQNRVDNVLTGGMSKLEREVLSELDLAQLSLQSREIAHGLFNVHERWILKRALSAKFDEAYRSSANVYVLRALDGLL